MSGANSGVFKTTSKFTVTATQAQQCHWNRYKAPLCLLNHLKTWTTTRWELEHWSVKAESNHWEPNLTNFRFSRLSSVIVDILSNVHYYLIDLIDCELMACQIFLNVELVKWWNGRFIQIIVLPLWAWHKISTLTCFVKISLFPNNIFGRFQDQSQFRIFSPNKTAKFFSLLWGK